LNNTDLIQEVRADHQPVRRRVRPAPPLGHERRDQEQRTKQLPWQSRSSSATRTTLNAREEPRQGGSRTEAPYLEENQFGGTLGGPVIRERTFFFGPTSGGPRTMLGAGQTLKRCADRKPDARCFRRRGSLPQIQALLKFLRPPRRR